MKKLIALTLLLLLIVVSTASCFSLTNPPAGDSNQDSSNGSDDSSGGDSSDDQEVDYGTATVYTSGSDVMIVTLGSRESNSILPLRQTLQNIGVSITNGNQYSYDADLEILVGKIPDREIVDTAYTLLERIEKQGNFINRYLVYANSGKIVIAFDENIYTDIQVVPYIIDELVSIGSYQSGAFALAEGVIMSGHVNLIDKQEDIDDENIRQKWNQIEASTTTDIYNALRKVYSMYDDKLIGWYANLYDPGIGGYYASSSGRDHEGFLPDPESTSQALNFLVNSGMLDEVEGGYESNIPDLMKHQIVYYCKSIQHTNGYFYNPVVPRSSLNTTGNSRRGRDLGWCTTLLTSLGSAPVYTTPNNTAGDGITADAYWDNLVEKGDIDASVQRPKVPVNPDDAKSISTSSLGASSVIAVSKIVSTSDVALVDASTDYLSNYKVFIDYLWKLNLDGNPYSAGNELNATYGQIGTSSTKLELSQGKFQPDASDDQKYQKYAGMNLKEITIAILNERINPETGLWGLTSTKNPTGTEFLFTNGFFKLISLYNSWHIPYPYPVKAANALLDGMVSDEPSLTNICEVYNIWAAIVSLRSNIQYCDAATKASVTKIINDTLTERGARAIEVSYEKQVAYKKADGGYSHHVVGSTTSHQGGIPTGLGLDEGDVDAIGKATTGLFEPMLKMFGLPDIPLYTTHHWMMYLDILLDLQPVVKYSYSEGAITPVHEYDTEPPATLFAYNTNGIATNTVSVTTEGNNGVLKVDKPTQGKQLIMYYYPNTSNGGADGVIFETRLKFTEITSSSQLSFSIAPKNADHNKRVTRVTLQADSKAIGSDIKVYEEIWSGTGTGTKAGSKFDTGANVGEWFTLRIEYFEGDMTDSTSPRVKVIVNDKTIYVSDQVYSQHLDASTINCVTVIGMSPLAGCFYFDDTFFDQSRGFYVDEPVTNTGNSTPSTPSTPTTPTEPSNPVPIPPVVTFDQDYSSALKISTDPYFAGTNKWEVIETNGNKTLFIDKNGVDDRTSSNGSKLYKGGVTLVLNVTEKEENANVAIYEFDLTLKNVESMDSQFTMGHSGKTGKQYSPFLYQLPKRYNETLHVTIKYKVLEVDSAGNVLKMEHSMQINDEKATTSQEIYFGATNLLNNSVALPRISDIQSVSFSLNNSFKGDAYVDNMKLRLVCEGTIEKNPTTATVFDFDSISALPVQSGGAKFADVSAYEASVATDGKVTDANGNDIPAWKGSVTVVGTDNKYVHLVDPKGNGGNNSQTTADKAKELDVSQGMLRVNGNFGEGDKIIYEMRLRFDKLEDGTKRLTATHIDLSLRAGSTRVARLYVGNSGEEGAVQIRLDVAGAETITTEIKAADGEWFNVRLEFVDSGASFDDSKSYMAVYINDQLVLKTNAQTSHTYNTVSNINRADIILSKDFVGVLDIDDVKITVTDSTLTQ